MKKLISILIIAMLGSACFASDKIGNGELLILEVNKVSNASEVGIQRQLEGQMKQFEKEITIDDIVIQTPNLNLLDYNQWKKWFTNRIGPNDVQLIKEFQGKLKTQKQEVIKRIAKVVKGFSLYLNKYKTHWANVDKMENGKLRRKYKEKIENEYNRHEARSNLKWMVNSIANAILTIEAMSLLSKTKFQYANDDTYYHQIKEKELLANYLNEMSSFLKSIKISIDNEAGLPLVIRRMFPNNMFNLVSQSVVIRENLTCNKVIKGLILGSAIISIITPPPIGFVAMAPAISGINRLEQNGRRALYQTPRCNFDKLVEKVESARPSKDYFSTAFEDYIENEYDHSKEQLTSGINVEIEK